MLAERAPRVSPGLFSEVMEWMRSMPPSLPLSSHVDFVAFVDGI